MLTRNKYPTKNRNINEVEKKENVAATHLECLSALNSTNKKNKLSKFIEYEHFTLFKTITHVKIVKVSLFLNWQMYINVGDEMVSKMSISTSNQMTFGSQAGNYQQ